MPSTTTRRRAGKPDGGQFAPQPHAEGESLPESEYRHPLPKAASFTMLGAYEDCGRRYFHDRILKDSGRHTAYTWRNFAELRRSAQRGSKYHAALNALDPMAAIDELAEREGMDAKTRDELRSLVQGYRMMEPDGAPEGARTEVYLKSTLLDMLFKGRIDRIQPGPDGGITVVDSKTGEPPSDVGPDLDPSGPVRRITIPDDIELSGGLLQVAFYADRLSEKGEQVDSVELHYPRLVDGRPTIFAAPATPDLRLGGRTELERIATSLKEAHRTGTFDATEGRACSTCPHTRGCPARSK